MAFWFFHMPGPSSMYACTMGTMRLKFDASTAAVLSRKGVESLLSPLYSSAVKLLCPLLTLFPSLACLIAHSA